MLPRLTVTGGALLAAIAAGAWFVTSPSIAHQALAPTPERSGPSLRSADNCLAAAARRTPVAPLAAPAGLYGAAEGSLLRYRLEVQTATRVAPRGGALTEVDASTLAGELTLAILARRADRIAVRMSATSWAGDLHAAQVHSPLAAELARGIVVCLDDHGAVHGCRFADGSVPALRNLWRALLGGWRVVVDSHAATWRTVESFVDGDLEVTYDWIGDPSAQVPRLARTACDAAIADRLGPRVSVDLRADASFDRRAGWLGTVSARVASSLEVCGTRTEYELQTSLELMDVALGEPTPAFDWDTSWQPLDGDADAAASADAARREHFAASLRGVSLEQLATALDAMLRRDSDEMVTLRALRDLAWKLRLDPDAAAAAERLLLPQSLGAAATATLLDALAEAGTPACQDVLVRMLASVAAPSALRDRALLATFHLRSPSAQLLAATKAVATATGEPLARRAMLLFGTLARRAEDSGTARQTLLALEQRAQADGTLLVWLAAVGNARAPEAAAIAERYVDDANPSVQRAAVDLLEHQHSARANAVLERLSESSPTPIVRARAAELLVERSSPGMLDATAERLFADPAAGVRATVVTALSRRPATPRLRTRVSQLVAGDDDGSVVAAARACLRSWDLRQRGR